MHVVRDPRSRRPENRKTISLVIKSSALVRLNPGRGTRWEVWERKKVAAALRNDFLDLVAGRL